MSAQDGTLPAAAEPVVLVTATEVSRLLGVSLATASRYGKQGLLLTWRRYPGGRPRFFAAEVSALRRGEDRVKARELAEAARDRLAKLEGARP